MSKRSFSVVSPTPFMAKKAKSSQSSKTVSISVTPKRQRRKSYGESGPEIKYLDTAIGPTAASTTAVVTPISTLAQGLTNITRVGNKIRIKSVSVQGFVDTVVGNANSCVVKKWSLVLDKEPEAAAAASYNQIYTSNGVNAHRNIDYSDRFTVLATGTISIDGASVSGPFPTRTFEAYRTCDINSKYILTTATQTAIGSNQLLFCYTDSAIEPDVVVTAQCRIRFTDE